MTVAAWVGLSRLRLQRMHRVIKLLAHQKALLAGEAQNHLFIEADGEFVETRYRLAKLRAG